MRVPSARLSPSTPVGIERERVRRHLLGATERGGLLLIAAPPGAGKTTAVGQLASATDAPFAWYRMAADDGQPLALLQHLQVAIGRACEDAGATGARPWTEMADLIDGLESVAGGRIVLVLDEVETLTSSASLELLDQVIVDLPDLTTLVLIGRSVPELNLSLLRVRGRLHQVDPDLLRFRSWEIDQLYRQHYDTVLTPSELAEVERRTGGWAAGLHLFHLATQGRDAAERRMVLDAMEGRRGPVWEFLAHNAVSAVSEDLRDFLFESVGFRRLRAEQCDRLRGRHDSAVLLDELSQRQLFVVPATDGDGYLVHDVFRAHLCGRIVYEAGESRLRARFAQAAAILEGDGCTAEALEAYARAAAWDDALRMLAERGEEIADRPGALRVESVPESVASDPWWQLAMARLAWNDGRLASAVAGYELVERNPLTSGAADLARRERMALAGFSTQGAPAALPWIAALRDVLLGVPGSTPGSDTAAPFVAAVDAALRAGADAGPLARSAGADERLDPRMRLVARALAALAAWLDGDDELATRQRDLNDLTDALPASWFTRLAAAVAGTVAGDPMPLRLFTARARSDGDQLGSAVADALGAVVAARDVEAELPESPASTLYAGLDAIRALWLHVARRRRDERASMPAREQAVVRARGADVLVALAAARPGELADLLVSVRWSALAQAPDRPEAAATTSPPDPAPASGPVVEIQCLGGFAVRCGGEAVDLEDLRPRAREVLRFLAARAGQPVHQDVLCAALWPGDTDVSARKKLQTAVSAVRGFLAEVTGGAVGVERQDASYRLMLDDLVVIDLRRLDSHAREGLGLAASDPDAASEHLALALQGAGGELLPESGSADWVVEERAQRARLVLSVASTLAELRAQAGDLPGAADACERGLLADRYDPGLWARLRDVSESSGDTAWKAYVDARHAGVLSELQAVPQI